LHSDVPNGDVRTIVVPAWQREVNQRRDDDGPVFYIRWNEILGLVHQWIQYNGQSSFISESSPIHHSLHTEKGNCQHHLDRHQQLSETKSMRTKKASRRRTFHKRGKSVCSSGDNDEEVDFVFVSVFDAKCSVARAEFSIFHFCKEQTPITMRTTQVLGSTNNGPSNTMRSPSSPKERRRNRRRNDEHAVLVEEDGMEYHQAALILEHYHRHARSLDIILEQEDDDSFKEDTDFHHYNVLLHQRYRKVKSLKRTKTFSCLTDLDNEKNTTPPTNHQQTTSPTTSTQWTALRHMHIR
jgi:hypothetical protein